jgi:type III pantothenate kinase
MILVFDIGNTEIALGLFEDAELIDHWRVSTHPERTIDEFGLLIRGLIRESGFDADAIDAAVVASVVPQMTATVAEMAELHLGADVLIVDAHTPLPIRLDVDEPLSVGADRIVNTLAASRLFRRDTIVVDLGTATTFDCITADGTFIGGVIAPGVRTGAETLVRRTARLPRVDLEPPPAVIGRRTDTSMRAGIVFGAVEAIDGIVRRIRLEWDRPDALVVATGGLAPLLGPHCATVDRIEPLITLQGLQLAHRAVRDQAASVARRRRRPRR